MSRFLALVRWSDVLVGAAVWLLLVAEWALLDRLFPANRVGCVESSLFSCWDLRAPAIALLTLPIWYAVWAVLLRPCPWPLRWLTPLAVSVTAYRMAELSPHLPVVPRVTVVVAGYLVPAAVMSAVGAAAAAPGR